MIPEILNLEEVADYLRVPKENIEELVGTNSIPYFRVGTMVRFRKDEVVAWTSSGSKDDLSHERVTRPIHGSLERAKWRLSPDGKTLFVFLNKNRDSALNYSLIPLSDEVRGFFPGYKVEFTMETAAGDFITRVTSAPAGTRIGDPKRGRYVQGGLAEWFRRHKSDIEAGNCLRIRQMEKGARYRLDLVPKEDAVKARVA